MSGQRTRGGVEVCPHRELACGPAGVNVLCALEHLDDSLGALDLEDLTLTDGAIGERELDNLGEFRELHTDSTHVSWLRVRAATLQPRARGLTITHLHVLENHQRTVHCLDRLVLCAHNPHP